MSGKELALSNVTGVHPYRLLPNQDVHRDTRSSEREGDGITGQRASAYAEPRPRRMRPRVGESGPLQPATGWRPAFLLLHICYLAGRQRVFPTNDDGPETLSFRTLMLVAGAGFEPATFGL